MAKKITKKIEIELAREFLIAFEGAEQERACRVLAGIEAGEHFIDTDKPEKLP